MTIARNPVPGSCLSRCFFSLGRRWCRGGAGTTRRRAGCGGRRRGDDDRQRMGGARCRAARRSDQSRRDDPDASGRRSSRCRSEDRSPRGAEPLQALDAYKTWLARTRGEDVFLLVPVARGTLALIGAGQDRALALQALQKLARAGDPQDVARLQAVGEGGRGRRALRPATCSSPSTGTPPRHSGCHRPRRPARCSRRRWRRRSAPAAPAARRYCGRC